jgi:predicted nucleotidyltransferase component of viral defense system
VAYAGRAINLETCGEIIAKKIWPRDDQGKARDLFDLCAVADAEPDAITAASPFLGKHGDACLQRLTDRATLAEVEFKAIDNLGFSRSFADCVRQARSVTQPILAGTAN